MMGVLPDERMAFAGNGICPNDASVLKRVTAVLVEQHDEWEVAERRYLSEESMALIDQIDPAELDDEGVSLAVTA
jgi:hypothetical protein